MQVSLRQFIQALVLLEPHVQHLIDGSKAYCNKHNNSRSCQLDPGANLCNWILFFVLHLREAGKVPYEWVS